jgi:hypothetical protein
MLKLPEFASTQGPVAQAFQPVLTIPLLVDIGHPPVLQSPLLLFFKGSFKVPL